MTLLRMKLFIGLSVLSSTLFANIYAKTYLMNEGRNGQNSSRFGTSQSARLNFEYYIGSFEGEKSNHPNDFVESMDELEFKNFQMTNDSGRPSLPYQSFIVAQDRDNLFVSLKTSTPKLFKGLHAQVAPSKPCRCDKDEPISYEVKGEYYNEESPLYRLESLGTYRGLPLTKVYVYGAHQTRDGLAVYPSLKLAIHSRDHSPVKLAKLNFGAANNEFLVISAKALTASAQEFVEFKEDQGYQVDHFIFEDEASDAESLKTFIKARYDQKKYQYAVLIGNENILPTFYRETSMSWDTPTDYPYFYMDGVDDYYPEVFYGRLSGKSDDEILAQIEKLKEYEYELWESRAGLNQVMGVASNEGVNPSDEEYVQQMLNPFENELGKNSTYYFQKNTDATVQNINKRFNEGLYWMNYIGHGSGHSWPSINLDLYESSDVFSLEPGHVKPVIIDVACQNGRFNDEGRLGETFMSAQVMGRSVGALSYFGGSVDISWDPPAIMAVGIGHSVGTNASRALPLYGHIMSGQTHLLNHYSDLEAAKENLVWYHLLGDPSLKVRAY